MSKWQEMLAGEITPGVYRLPHRAARESLEREARASGWQVFVLDGDKISDKKSFLDEAARAMRFPSYFGHNWDAFEESLNDLEWAPGEGYLVLYPHAGRFAATPEWHTALSILKQATANWREQGKPMCVLVGGVEAGIPEL